MFWFFPGFLIIAVWHCDYLVCVCVGGGGGGVGGGEGSGGEGRELVDLFCFVACVLSSVVCLLFL